MVRDSKGRFVKRPKPSMMPAFRPLTRDERVIASRWVQAVER